MIRMQREDSGYGGLNLLKLNKKIKFYLPIVFLNLLFFLTPLFADKRKIIIGIQTGYSFYIPEDYHESETLWSKSVWGNKLGPIFGVNLQLEISPNGIFQAEINHQKRTFFDEYIDYQYPEFNRKREENDSYLSLHLNFLYKFYIFERARIILYSFAGLGRDKYCPVSLKIGIGGKRPLFSQTYLNVSISYISSLLLYGAEGGGIDFYPFALRHISLNMGLEYKL